MFNRDKYKYEVSYSNGMYFVSKKSKYRNTMIGGYDTLELAKAAIAKDRAIYYKEERINRELNKKEW